MKENLMSILKEIGTQNKTILQLCKELGDIYSLKEINEALVEIKKTTSPSAQNAFGNCGIYPEANPCGDACEY